MKHPAFILALCLIAGQMMGQALPVSPVAALAAAALATGVHFAARKRWPSLLGGGQMLWLAVICVGVAQQRAIDVEERVSQAAIARFQTRSHLSLEGTLCSDVQWRDSGALFDVSRCRLAAADGKVFAIPMAVRVLCRDGAARQVERARPGRGDQAVIRFAQLSSGGPANPDVFNYTAYLRQEGVAASVVCCVASQVEFPASGKSRRLVDRLLQGVAHYRDACIALIHQKTSPEAGNLIEAMFFGGGTRLTPQWRDVFARTGLLHLFAVSGLNTAIIAFLIFLAFSWMGLSPRVAYLCSIPTILCYVAMTGFQPSVVRAALMLACAFSPFFLRYKVEGISALAVAALLTLAIWPRALWQISFQLSYLCMFGMFTLGPVLREMFSFQMKDEDGPPRGWRQTVKQMANIYILWPFQMSLAVNLALLPLLCVYFHQVSIVNPVANILSAAPAFFAFCSTTLLVTVGFLGGFVANALGLVAQWSAQALAAMANALAFAPGASVKAPSMPLYLVGAYYAWLFGGAHVRPARSPVEEVRRRATFAIRLAGVAILIVCLPLFRGLDRSLRATFIDVGQGDSCFLEFPDGRTMLVDGGQGPPYDMGQREVVPALDARGVERLDLVIGTHPDADHVGGLASVLREFPTGLVLHSGSPKDTGAAGEFLEEARLLARRFEEVRAGQRIEGPGYEIRFLWPAQATVDARETNEMSVVVLARYGRFGLLLAGDVGEAAENALIDGGAPLRATVLKASHHGSAHGSSLSFLEAVRPLAAVISCGADNRYGHPAPEVLERLKDIGALVYRTDLEGAIEFKTDGRRLWARVEGK